MTAEFYKGKDIFITGGSGILGRGIIEKFLRSTEVNRIYMLLRERKGVSVEDRLEKFKQGIIFRRLRQENPQVLDKITYITGDINEPLLGLSDLSLHLVQDAEIFIHSAATVRFNEPLRKAIKLNVGGTYESIKLAATMKNLKLFVHVSTFYSSPCLNFVDNIMYPAPMDWKLALKLTESHISENEINALTRKFIKDFPNTYTFTKNLSENVAYDHQHLFPILITRPSVIVNSLKEPEPGYVETLYGITGVSAASATGLFRTAYAKSDAILDLLPLDIVVSLHIMNIVRFCALVESSSKRLDIALMCAGPLDPYTAERRLGLYTLFLEKYPCQKCVWFPAITITSCYYYFKFRFILYQLIPSIFLDMILRMFRIPPGLLALQRKLYSGVLELNYFVSRTFQSDGGSYRSELMEMSDGDVFDIKSMAYLQLEESSASKAYEEFILSNRRYILKEKDESLPAARIQYQILKYLDLIVKWLIWFVFAKFVFKMFFQAK